MTAKLVLAAVGGAAVGAWVVSAVWTYNIKRANGYDASFLGTLAWPW